MASEVKLRVRAMRLLSVCKTVNVSGLGQATGTPPNGRVTDVLAVQHGEEWNAVSELGGCLACWCSVQVLKCRITSLRSGVILSVPHVPPGKLRFGARLVQLANEVPSQLLRQCGDEDDEAVVCGHVVGMHDDAVLSARGQTTVITHGGGQVAGDNLAGGQNQDGNRLSGANAMAPPMNASGGRLPPGVIQEDSQ